MHVLEQVLIYILRFPHVFHTKKYRKSPKISRLRRATPNNISHLMIARGLGSRIKDVPVLEILSNHCQCKNNNLRRRAGAVLFSFSAMVQAPSTIVEMISDRINVSLLTELVSNSFR